jgi:hypothetical protein
MPCVDVVASFADKGDGLWINNVGGDRAHYGDGADCDGNKTSSPTVTTTKY